MFTIGRKGQNLYWRHYAGENADEIVINEYRPAEPFKGFVFKSKEKILEKFEDAKTNGKPLAVVGVKACDLHALKILDDVFMEGDFKDPFYIDARKNTFIISSDCTSFKNVCFCLRLGVEPFPKENFDLNFSELKDAYIITIGSDRGAEVLKKIGVLVKEASDSEIKECETAKKEFTKKLEASIRSMNLPPKEAFRNGVISNFKSDTWLKFSATCVECGGCNTICPTCHCFFLVDQKADDKFQRLKVWDSCLLKRFAKVAGGANPRKHLSERLRNRFDKKFNYFPTVLGLYACTGCGRCIEACPGDIDIREILKDVCKLT